MSVYKCEYFEIDRWNENITWTAPFVFYLSVHWHSKQEEEQDLEARISFWARKEKTIESLDAYLGVTALFDIIVEYCFDPEIDGPEELILNEVNLQQFVLHLQRGFKWPGPSDYAEFAAEDLFNYPIVQRLLPPDRNYLCFTQQDGIDNLLLVEEKHLAPICVSLFEFIAQQKSAGKQYD